MNKFIITGLLISIASLSAQSMMGYMGRRNAIGAEVLISPAFTNPVKDLQQAGQAFYGMNVQVGGTYLLSLSHKLRVGLVYTFEETAVVGRFFNYNDWNTQNGQTMQLTAHSFGIPLDIFLGNHRAPLGTYFRFQPELVMTNLKNNGGFISPEAVNYENSSILPGITMGYGVNYVFANRIMLDIAFSGSLYFPMPIPWGFTDNPLIEEGSPDNAVSRRLTAARIMMLRTGLYFLF